MNNKSRYDPKIHHRRSIRLKGYDYSQAGLYFITICCQDRACLFGKVEDGEMELNEFGKIAYDEWMTTPELRPNVELAAFIVMPNHIHGIITISRRGELHSSVDNNSELHSLENEDEPHSQEFKDESHSPDKKGECNSPRPSGTTQTVGAIVRGYKSSVTKKMGFAGFNGKLWQRNYYENIIRDQRAFDNISNYIINNLQNGMQISFIND